MDFFLFHTPINDLFLNTIASILHFNNIVQFRYTLIPFVNMCFSYTNNPRRSIEFVMIVYIKNTKTN